jgi:putative FmdB family regulatory protein
MPTYEFRCLNGHDFERFFSKISDSPSELECPVCGQLAARQISGGGGLVFKGSGFYSTDYGKNAHRGPGAKGEAKETGEQGAGSGGESRKGDSSAASAASGEGTRTDSAKGESGKTAPKPGETKPAAKPPGSSEG